MAVKEYYPLPANRGRPFQGPIPQATFTWSQTKPKRFSAVTDAAYEEVVVLT